VVLNPDFPVAMTERPPDQACGRDAAGQPSAGPDSSPAHATERGVQALDERHDVHVNTFLAASNNHLFNEPRFFRLHSVSSKDVYAQLVRRADSRVVATIGFHDVGAGVFTSLRRGTFGGLTQNHAVEPTVLEAFAGHVLDDLRSRGATSVDIRCAPLTHDPAPLSAFINLLLRRGAVVSGHELNFDMTIDDRAFADRIDYGNVKRIRKCAREGFVARTLAPSHHAPAYDLIRDNRARRGYPLTMSVEQMGEMAAAFPDRVHYFGAFCDEAATQWAAAAICMAITPAILYVFYWGDAPDLGSYSPVAFLAAHIHDFAREHGFRLLDAGTASSNGKPNPGLVAFKRNLGFTESLKLSFREAH